MPNTGGLVLKYIFILNNGVTFLFHKNKSSDNCVIQCPFLFTIQNNINLKNDW